MVSSVIVVLNKKAAAVESIDIWGRTCGTREEKVTGATFPQTPSKFWPNQKHILFHQKTLFYLLPSLPDFQMFHRFCEEIGQQIFSYILD